MGASLATHLFLQLAVILISCRVSGKIFRYLGQSQVVSEMIVGTLLGPSLFGALFPQAQAYLFPREPVAPGVQNPSMTILFAISQVGLTVYMFLVGLELDLNLLTRHSKKALLISVFGVLAPAIMGGGQGWVTAHNRALFATALAPWQAALFMASAMSITAFPMLARILYESGLIKTYIGTMTLGAAAFDDAIAGCLFACMFASLQNSPQIAWLAAGGGLLYTVVMFALKRPVFSRFETRAERDQGVTPDTLMALLVLLMVCAWVTDALGVHAIFGAFLLGVTVPRGKFGEGVRQALEPLTTTLLLPVFFIYSGLNTRISLLASPELLGITVLTLLSAFLCKGGGCMLAARLSGLKWREAASIGALMNARGMMELILVNIALQRGLITPGLFAILATMAILTTLLASPLYHWLAPKQALSE